MRLESSITPPQRPSPTQLARPTQTRTCFPDHRRPGKIYREKVAEPTLTHTMRTIYAYIPSPFRQKHRMWACISQFIEEEKEADTPSGAVTYQKLIFRSRIRMNFNTKFPHSAITARHRSNGKMPASSNANILTTVSQHLSQQSHQTRDNVKGAGSFPLYDENSGWAALSQSCSSILVWKHWETEHCCSAHIYTYVFIQTHASLVRLFRMPFKNVFSVHHHTDAEKRAPQTPLWKLFSARKTAI